MQIVIDIQKEQDIQLLLAFLERLEISYQPFVLPKKKVKVVEKKAPTIGSRASRFRGKLSAETADALQKYVEQSRNEWERSF